MIKSTLKIVFGTLLFLVVVGVLIGGGETSPTVTQRANQTMKKITDQVAVDSVEISDRKSQRQQNRYLRTRWSSGCCIPSGEG